MQVDGACDDSEDEKSLEEAESLLPQFDGPNDPTDAEDTTGEGQGEEGQGQETAMENPQEEQHVAEGETEAVDEGAEQLVQNAG